MYNKQSGMIDIYTKSNYEKNLFYLMQNDVALETTSTHNSKLSWSKFGTFLAVHKELIWIN